jgi:Glycosyltransferase
MGSGKPKIVMLGYAVENTEVGLLDSLAARPGMDFTFISSCWYGSHMPQGYAEQNNFRIEYDRPFNLFYADDPKAGDKAIAEADLLIVAATDQEKFRKYVGKKPICFFKERYFKKPKSWRNIIHDFFSFNIQFRWHNPKKMYLFTAGAFTYGDYFRYHCFRHRAYSFPYAVLGQQKNIESLLPKFSQGPVTIAFVGNLQPAKRVDILLRYAVHLKEQKVDFRIFIVGKNFMGNSLTNYVKSNGLEKNVLFAGSIVGDILDRSAIYVSTGGRLEGFNTGLYSAMQSACACVSCFFSGSSLELIKNGKTGLIYTTEADFFSKMDKLVSDRNLQKNMGVAAFEYYQSTWRTSFFGERFEAMLPQLLTGGKGSPYSDGPMAPALLIKYWGSKPASKRYDPISVIDRVEDYRDL